MSLTRNPSFAAMGFACLYLYLKKLRINFSILVLIIWIAVRFYMGENKKIKEAFDDEAFIIKFMSDTSKSETGLFPHCHKTMRLYKNLFNTKLWTDNSADTNNPPDFYSNRLKLMMDVMQVSEYAYEEQRGKKTKHVDPMKQREAKLLKDLAAKGIVAGKDCPVIVVANGDSSIGLEHNYQQYLNEFKRVVGYHNSRIPEYEANHPGLKTILFVFDQSSQYVVSAKKITKEDTKAGNVCTATELHCWFMDKNFVDFIASLDCEYVVWATPCKGGYEVLPWSDEVPQMPRLCIFKVSDCKNLDTKVYDEDLLVSVEDNSGSA